MKCFPSTLRCINFENATTPGHFGVLFKDYSAREVTLLSTGGPDVEYD